MDFLISLFRARKSYRTGMVSVGYIADTRTKISYINLITSVSKHFCSISASTVVNCGSTNIWKNTN